MTDDLWESGKASRPPLRSDVVERRPGSSEVICEVDSLESAICESVDPWPLWWGTALDCSGCVRDNSSIDRFLRLDRSLDLWRCLVGWSKSLLLGAVVMIVGGGSEGTGGVSSSAFA